MTCKVGISVNSPSFTLCLFWALSFTSSWDACSFSPGGSSMKRTCSASGDVVPAPAPQLISDVVLQVWKCILQGFYLLFELRHTMDQSSQLIQHLRLARLQTQAACRVICVAAQVQDSATACSYFAEADNRQADPSSPCQNSQSQSSAVRLSHPKLRRQEKKYIFI